MRAGLTNSLSIGIGLERPVFCALLCRMTKRPHMPRRRVCPFRYKPNVRCLAQAGHTCTTHATCPTQRVRETKPIRSETIANIPTSLWNSVRCSFDAREVPSQQMATSRTLRPCGASVAKRYRPVHAARRLSFRRYNAAGYS